MTSPLMTRRALLGAAASAPLVALAAPAFAAEPDIFAVNGLAIRGYDPVAYFTEGAAVEGDAAFSVEWKGATWQFASAENQAMFEASPEAYAPQYGGYCAYAVSRGYTATTAANAWHVHEDKLYLNFSRPVRILWRRDIPGNIVKGDANWPNVLG